MPIPSFNIRGSIMSRHTARAGQPATTQKDFVSKVLNRLGLPTNATKKEFDAALNAVTPKTPTAATPAATQPQPNTAGDLYALAFGTGQQDTTPANEADDDLYKAAWG